MLILADLNVVLDVIQKRAPHYAASAALIEEIVARRIGGALASHAVTTLHYLIGRYQRTSVADRTVDWLLRHFDIAAVGRPELLRACALGWNDFEDAVVSAAAESSRCDAIVTRNVKDFRASAVPVLTPEECLLGLPDAMPDP